MKDIIYMIVDEYGDNDGYFTYDFATKDKELAYAMLEKYFEKYPDGSHDVFNIVVHDTLKEL